MTTKSATLRMPRRSGYSGSRRRRTSRKLGVGLGALSVKAVAALALLAALLVASFVTSWKIRQVASELETLRAQYQQQMKEQQTLAADLEKLLDRKSLEKLGRSLGLHPASKDQVRIVRQ